MKRTRTLAATLAATTALVLAPAASADRAPGTGVELNQPADQVVAVEAKFDWGKDQREGMEALRELRGRVWDQNVPFRDDRYPGVTTIRDAAAAEGFHSREAYVNGVENDYGYSMVALQRSIEEQHFYGIGMDHTRPYNSTCYGNCGNAFTATILGRSPSAENIHSVADISVAMRGWGVKELPALQLARGEWNTSNGHVHSLINPANRYVGFAAAFTRTGESSVAILGTEFSGGACNKLDRPQIEVLYRPANGRETPSMDPQTLGAIGSSDVSPQYVLKIVTTILSVISALGFVYNNVKPYLPF